MVTATITEEKITAEIEEVLITSLITVRSLISELRLYGFSGVAYGFSTFPYGFPVQILTDGEITANVTE